MLNVRVKKINNNAVLPEYKTIHSSGADVYACIEKEIIVKPMEIVLIPTGLVMEIPDGYEIQVRPRSGLALNGITVINTPGTIDADYRGEIKIILINLGKKEYTIKPHDRIAQLVLMKVEKANFNIDDELSKTDRGEGGFGSTGINR